MNVQGRFQGAIDWRIARFGEFPAAALAHRESLAGKTVPDYSAGVSASWEPDLFGRVRDSVNGAQADAQASEADLEGVRLSMSADLAADYFSLRSLDTQKKLLDDSVNAYAAALKLLNRSIAGSATAALPSALRRNRTWFSSSFASSCANCWFEGVVKLTGVIAVFVPVLVTTCPLVPIPVKFCPARLSVCPVSASE